nr:MULTISPECIES: hypothetical protein [unclassified Haloferax]
MVTNRITVSLDEDAQSALDGLTGRTDKVQRELVTLVVVWLGLRTLYTVAADMGVF